MLSKIRYRLEILRVLKPLSFGVRRFLLFIFFISLISISLNFINPLFYKIFIDDVIIAKKLSLMPIVAAGYLSVFVINIILGYIKNYCMNRYINRVTFRAKMKILCGFFNRDFIEYDRQSVGDMKMRMEDDTGCIASYAYSQSIGYIIAYVYLIISAVLLLCIEWHLALFSFVSIPLTFWLDHIIAKREAVVNNLQRENDQKMSSWLHASVQGWREIKALNLQKHEELQFTRYIHKFAVYFGTWINYWVVRVIIIPKIKEEFLMQFSLYFFGGLLIINKQLEIGVLLIFMQYYSILADSVRTISGTDAELLSAKPQSDRLLSELNKANIIRNKKSQSLNLLECDNIIEFQNVTFSYDNSDRTVLNDFNLFIRKGERVAIIGKSGAGKTTILKLMSGMLYPTSGNIRFCGEDISNINLEYLHKYLGFIMQENILFNATIKENLLYAKMGATNNELEIACQKAFILEFIKTLPDGMETVIGERGIKLSGGQKQRLILARQFLRDADIFILDEATSALDQYSESIIHDAIESIGKDKTIIMVAHRKSSISLCDRIISL